MLGSALSSRCAMAVLLGYVSVRTGLRRERDPRHAAKQGPIPLQIVTLLQSRQLDRDARALSRRVADADLAAVQQHDFSRERKAEAEAVRFARLKGDEQTSRDFVIDSCAVVGH